MENQVVDAAVMTAASTTWFSILFSAQLGVHLE